jgi:hypothetical protein
VLLSPFVGAAEILLRRTLGNAGPRLSPFLSAKKRKAMTVSNGLKLLSAVALITIATGVFAQQRGLTLVDKVRTANDRFKDVSVAVAEGYAAIPCASGVDGGAMGVHYVSERLLKADAIDIAHPQAVMYEPGADGKMTLIAVEYITSKGPAALQGQLFNFLGAPNRYGLGPFYELHVWAWKSNPRGAFADMNPSVSCEHAH